MKTIKNLFILATLVSLGACSTLKTNTVKESDISGPTVIQKPVVADLDVSDKKVTGTYTTSSKNTVTYAKQMAINEALKPSNADVLIEPRYEITKSFRKIEVTVTGYPATYKNFRPMETSDTTFIKANQFNHSTGAVELDKTGNRGKVALIAGGSVAAAVGLFFLTILFL